MEESRLAPHLLAKTRSLILLVVIICNRTCNVIPLYGEVISSVGPVIIYFPKSRRRRAYRCKKNAVANGERCGPILDIYILLGRAFYSMEGFIIIGFYF